MQPKALSLPVLILALSVVGCAEERVYVPVATRSTDGVELVAEQEPPPPQREVVVVAPRPGYIWAPGYWRWGGSRWFWAPGRWMAPRPGYSWHHGGWGRRGRVWVYRPGYWYR